MADFFSNLFNGLTGQQPIPQQNIMSTQDMLSGGLGALQSTVPQLTSISGQLGAGALQNQLTNEATTFGAPANQLQKGYFDRINSNLALGGELSPEIRQDLVRQLAQVGGTTGLGYTKAGVGQNIYNTGMEQYNIQRQREADARNAITLLPSTSTNFNPSPMEVLQSGTALGGDLRNVEAAKQDYENKVAQIKADNFTSLLNTGTKLLGSVAGGVFGGPLGASIGGSIGGSVFGRPRAGQNPLMSNFSGLMGGGGFGGVTQAGEPAALPSGFGIA